MVLLGYSLKPFGARDPLGETLFRLVDNAKKVVLEFPPALERASSQVPAIIGRPGIQTELSIELTLDDAAIAGSPYARRRLLVLRPAG